jgi:hypothetical protein
LASLGSKKGVSARRPKVQSKRVWVERAPEAVIAEAFREAEARDPEHRRRWVVLLDGNKDQLALTKDAEFTSCTPTDRTQWPLETDGVFGDEHLLSKGHG